MEPPVSATATATATATASAPTDPAPASAPAPAPASASTSSTTMERPAPATISTASSLAEAWKLLYPPAPARPPPPAPTPAAIAAAENLLHRKQQLQAMEVFNFEGVDFVRLRLMRSGRPAYLHAAEDGCSVRLDPRRESHNAVWAVTTRFYRDMEINCVLLRGAYGRYLGSPDATACGSLRCPFPSPCRAAKQRDGREYDRFEVPEILWRAVATSRQGAFLLQDATERYLRANSRCLLPCCSRVHVSDRCTATQWAVERVPRAAARPDLPEPTHSLFARLCQPLSCLCERDDLQSLFARLCQPLSCLCGREIRWGWLDGNGAFNEYELRSERYTGRLTIGLRTKLVHRAPNYPPPQDYTLCVQAGRYGQLTPLLVNLPRSRERLTIVILRNTAADNLLIYPDVNAVAEEAAVPEAVL